jgi:hypothetical protein
MTYIVRLVLVLLTFCCSVGAQEQKAQAMEVSYCDLARTPQSFSGKRIRVRAVYRYGFEIQRLDSPECCPNGEIKVWVDTEQEPNGGSLDLLRKLPKGMGLALATFSGKFEIGGPYGDGGYRFRFTIDRIERLEAKAKPSARHEPDWAPQNCEKVGRLI